MASYGTDLVLMTDAESGTWTELASPYNAGGSPAADGENYIQGSDCRSQTTGTKSGLVFSILYDAGSDISSSFATDEVMLMWQFYAVGVNLETFANGGLRAVIASDTSNANAYDVGGRDFARNPYGGWMNVAVDPTKTADYTIGAGNGGAWRYFGSMPYTLASISKGTPHAVDAIRYGRGQIYCTGTGANFTDLAIANDQNTATAFTGNTTSGSATITNISDIKKAVDECQITGTNIPAGARITSVNEGASSITIDTLASGTATGTSFSQYNRLGLFQLTNKDNYLWKGLMSLGLSGTSTTFSDSNKTILVDDTPAVYAAFNKIEINNASTSVTWNNITFTSLGTVSPGRFEMVDNATVNMTGCTFNTMDTFIFQSNATLVGCNFNSCGIITHGGADLEGCGFTGYEGTADTSYLVYNVNADPDGELDNCEFTKGAASTHAIEFGTTSPLTMTLRGIDFSGYNASNGQTDSTLHVKRTSGTVTINLVGCTGNISYKSDGATVLLVTNPVTVLVTVKDESTSAAIQYAAVTIKAAATTSGLPYQDSVTISQTAGVATVAHTAHGLSTGQKIEISGANENNYNRIKTITVTGPNAYTYPIDSGTSSPATGTITATAVIIDGETDVNGQISDQRSYSVDQNYTGVVQQGTRIPIYKARPVSGSIDKDVGAPLNVLLTKD